MNDYDVIIGDILYCIINKGVERELEIGKVYTVDNVWLDREPLIFQIKETKSRWMKWGFSKDPNHQLILEYNANKYNF